MKQKTALITGASRGIGAAVALRLAEAGCNLLLVARQLEELEQVAHACRQQGVSASCFSMDLRQSEMLSSQLEAILSTHGTPDIMVNNAGIGSFGLLEDLSLEQLDDMLRVNVMGSWILSKAVVPGMKRRGHGLLVNILSDAAYRSFSGGTAYCASKFAQEGLFGALRAELAGSGLGMCNLYPGLVNTHFNGKTPKNEGIQGVLQPQEVAEAVWQAIASDGKLQRIDLKAN